MRKKLIALGLATALCVSSSITAFADSSTKNTNSSTTTEESSSSDSSSDDSSSSSTTTASTKTTQTAATNVAAAAPGAAVSTKAVTVKIAAADGTTTSASLETVVASATTTIIAAAAATPENAVATVQSLMTSAVSPTFTATVEALAEIKGADMVVNNMGTVKTAASARDVYGNTIASAGVVKNVTSGALIMLMSVNADGTVEYVEGVVDPATGSVLGAFQGTPAVITVLVLA